MSSKFDMADCSILKTKKINDMKCDTHLVSTLVSKKEKYELS